MIQIPQDRTNEHRQMTYEEIVQNFLHELIFQEF